MLKNIIFLLSSIIGFLNWARFICILYSKIKKLYLHLSLYYSCSLSQTNLNLKPNKLFFSTVCLNSSETNAYLVFSSEILNMETFSTIFGKKNIS